MQINSVQKADSEAFAESCIELWIDHSEKHIRYDIAKYNSDMDLKGSEEDEYSFTASSESMHVEEVLKYLRSMGAIIEEPPQVRRYLYRYPDIADLSQIASELVYRYFDTKVQLSLKLYHDCETKAEYITLYVRQNRYDKSTMSIIKKIRREYRNLYGETSGRFLLTTDFRLIE